MNELNRCIVPRLRSLCSPSPEAEESLLLEAHKRPLVASYWSIIKGDFEQYSLNADHDDRLNEQCYVIAGTWPIEELQYRSREHYQRDIKGESGGCLGSVDRKDLIRIGSDWRKYQATTVSEEDSQRPSHLTYKIGANVEIKVEMNAMMETGRFDRYGEVDPLIEFAKSYWAFNHNH